MKRANAVLFSLLMIVSSLAGCIGGEEVDTSEYQDQIAELEEMLEAQNQTIAQRDATIDGLEDGMSDATQMIQDHEEGIAILEAYRDSLLIQLENSNNTSAELMVQLESANASIASMQSQIASLESLRDYLFFEIDEWQIISENNRVNLNNALLGYTVLEGADLSGAILSNTDFSHANLRDANMSGALMNEADLRYANLSNANLYNANLYNADLSHADLSNAILNYAYLKRGVLNEANLSDVNLTGADLNDALLYDADLSGADLSNVNFDYAWLNGANLTGADLSGADLRYADDLTGVYWYNTICPDGTNSDDNGDTCVNNL